MECISLCAWHFFSQCIYALSHPIPTLARDLLMETCFCSFLIKNLLTNYLLCSATHTIAVDALFSHVCMDKWLPAASMLCTVSLSTKKAQAVSLSYAQSKAEMNHTRRIGLLVAV